ncbi:MAG TPA: glycoside hydrolase family 3 protein [Paracoccaceae bacterium]|nr:glycoside hydrolase family 3 protein [Paracoccaceae bacterium]
MASAAIFGLSGPDPTPQEAAFFRDADPWGFILFARNVEDPGQLTRLTARLRETVGRNAPVLIDQEGGRVQRLGPPHWRPWRDVLHLFDGADGGADEARALEAVRLRYRIIADELRAVGIDVNCAPVLDVPAPGGHEIIGARALGRTAAEVARRGRAVCEGLLAGGVLPVIKHLPGHGRAPADSHLSLPRVAATRDELDRVDFAPFRALADQMVGMTAHVVYDALDPERCATLSPAAVEAVRRDIGFDGLLMTDDLSMRALSGPMAERARAALTAGCDIVLHCNGDMAEMQAVAGAVPTLSGRAAARAARAEAARRPPDRADITAAVARYQDLTGEALHG